MQSERYVPVTGGRVWCRAVGSGPGLPLLVLHGGPGFTCEYLDTLAELGDERTVVLYDQLGCGRSDRPDDPALWTVPRFVDEVQSVATAFGWDRFHLLGQSWGCMLGVDYILAHPGTVAAMVLASPPLSIPWWMRDAARLRSELPAEVRETLTGHEERGFTACPEYRAAVLEYSRRHLCRASPWPDAYERSFAGEGEQVYHTMWGPNEFTVTGTLADYDRTGDLPDITIPTLYTCGRYDEATPEATRAYCDLMPRAQMRVFEHSAHVPHLEEKPAYLGTVRAFLHEHDGDTGRLAG